MQEKLYLFLYYYRIIPIPRYIFSGTQDKMELNKKTISQKENMLMSDVTHKAQFGQDVNGGSVL